MLESGGFFYHPTVFAFKRHFGTFRSQSHKLLSSTPPPVSSRSLPTTSIIDPCPLSVLLHNPCSFWSSYTIPTYNILKLEVEVHTRLSLFTNEELFMYWNCRLTQKTRGLIIIRTR
ncbi:unnamed protein product [Ilex paraguariensis]|uniref:Uncharacterized protein n=1 Tax=Ilex paraguariensis TaxID=185542 RepID=A0ABC8REG3_9AQUA